MNRLLLLLGFVAALGLSVQAQKELAFINAPSSIAGQIDFVRAGFGGEFTSVISGEGIRTVPAFACNSGPITNGAAISGNIALIDRGNCNFDEKCLNAQIAGAIMVIVMNSNSATLGGPAFAMGVATQAIADQITIPCVMVSFDEGNRIKNAITSGEKVTFSIGLFPDQNVDLRINNLEKIAHAPAGTVPLSQIKTAADFDVLVAALPTNDGYQEATNVKAKATITHVPSGTEVFNSTSTDTINILPDSTTGILIAEYPFVSNNKGLGQYKIDYSVSSDSTEKIIKDNIATSSFYVTKSAYSKARWNMAANEPLVTTYFGPSAANRTGFLEMLSPYSLHNGQGYSIDSLVFRVLVSSPSTLAGVTLEGYIYRWDDVNQDGEATNDEMMIAAAGTYTFPSGTTASSGLVRMNLENFSGLEPHYIIPENEGLYVAAIRYVGDAPMFFPFDFGIDYGINFQIREAAQALDWDAYPYLQTTLTPAGVVSFEEAGLFNDSGLEPYMGYSGAFWGALATGMIMSEQVVSNKDLLTDADVQVQLSPNPATTELVAKIKLAQPTTSMVYHIIDINGRLITQFNDKSGQEYVSKFDVSELPAGQYILKVQTDKGFQKANFTVVK
ncbi:MAG: T9SS type A sorting domain-containing protein [Saprospiraceae bacterium]|nr:T9SS type A sorting domain-containing protein [Saprospiraceae bacterium]